MKKFLAMKGSLVHLRWSRLSSRTRLGLRSAAAAFSMVAGLLVCTAGATAATLTAGVSGSGSNCPASGDPRCQSGTSFTPPIGNDGETVTNASSGSIAAAGLSYLDPRLGTANSLNGTAVAGPGFLQLTAGATVSSTPPLGSSSLNLQELGSSAGASFLDRVTIPAPTPALQGASAIVTGAIVMEGSLSASAVNNTSNVTAGSVARSTWSVRYAIADASGGQGGAFVPGFFGQSSVSNGGAASQGPALPVAYPVVYNIQFGVPFDFSIGASIGASGTLSSATAKPLTEGVTVVSAQALLGNTVFWNGISSIVSGGQQVTGFTVTSESGANYATSLKPVPEPGTVWLVAAGALALVARARRAGRVRS